MDTLKVKFTHYTKVRADRHPYTMYEITVQSPSTISWVIYKRYNNFDKLHKQLSKNMRLPALPPKRIFQQLDPEFIKNRMSQLQEYVRQLLKLPNLVKNPVLIEFLKVPDSVKPMLLNDNSSGAGGVKAPKLTGKSGVKPPPSYPDKSEEERKVYELVDALKSNPNRVAAIAVFENYFFSFRPRLSKDAIRHLFLGHTADASRNSGGLVQTCGNDEYSKVASRAALDLICRLLDVERNKNARAYVDVFVGLNAARLRSLNIESHIREERGSRLGAFRLLSVLRERMKDTDIRAIVGDQGAAEQYFRWAERKTGFVAPIYSEPQSSQDKSVNLADSGPENVAQNCFQELLRIAADSGEWTPVRPMPTRASRQGSDAKSAATAAVPFDSKARLEYRTKGDVTTVRMRAEMSGFSVDQIAPILRDPARKRAWDPKFHKGTVVQPPLSNNADIVHYVYKSFSSPYKYRDFCLMRSWTTLEDGRALLAMRSVLHPQVPEQKDYIRAILYPTGYIVAPVPAADGKQTADAKRCRVTFVAQMDRESVLLMSPDLLGETDELLASISNFARLMRESQTAQPAAKEAKQAPSVQLAASEQQSDAT